MMLATVIATGLAACASPEAAPGGLLNLYAISSIAGMHSHAADGSDHDLVWAEKRYARRRAEAQVRLAKVCGREELQALDDEMLEEARQVVWTRGLTRAEEWRRLSQAQRALGRLERQMKRMDS